MKSQNIIQKLTNGWSIIALFIFVFLFDTFILGAASPNYGKVMLLDYLRVKSPQHLYELISDYYSLGGNNGLKPYIMYELTVEMIYPIIIAFFFFIAYHYIVLNLLQFKRPLLISSMVPVATMLIDYLESIGVIMMLQNYPKTLMSIAQITITLTNIKLTLFGIENWLLGIGLVIVFFKKLIQMLKSNSYLLSKGGPDSIS